MNELRTIVNPNETILYEGRPNEKCFWFENIFNPLLPLALLWGIIDLAILGISYKEITTKGVVIFIILPFILFHMMPVWIYLCGAIFSSKNHRNTSYIITDKTIYISGGTFTKHIESFSFSDISDIQLHRGLFDRFFDVGDIKITSNKRDKDGNRISTKISSISGYVDIYNMLKTIYENEKNNY